MTYKNSTTASIMFDIDDHVLVGQVATLPEARGLGHARIFLRWLALFLVLALAASGLLTAGWFYTRRLNERLTAQNSRINSLETVISEQQSEMEAMEKQYATQTAAVEVYKKLTGLTPEQALEPPKQGAGRRP